MTALILDVGFLKNNSLRERRRQACRRWYLCHRDQKLEYDKKYHQTHNQEKHTYDKQYREKHKEQTRQNYRSWLLKNYELRRAYWRDYHVANKDRRSEQHRAWRLKNMERRRIYKRIWSKSHKDSLSNTRRRWKEKDPKGYRACLRRIAAKRKDKIRAYQKVYSRQYYLNNKARITARNKAYSANHPEIRRKSALTWRKKHPEKYLAHQRAGRARRKSRVRGAHIGTLEQQRQTNQLIRAWHSERWFHCYWCGRKFRTGKLHIDHKVAIARGGPHIADNLVRSCAQCNLRKKHYDPSEEGFRGQLQLVK